ncbi:sulfurtransferase [Piscinibacter sakaiensis]|uniref:sulfurtransferase n=1 Tax=Piscinibacter sakaiensis TaxID=1547922 RepID=UPI003AAC09A6
MSAGSPLVTAAQLAQALAAEPRPVVIDVSFDLADPAAGEREYRSAHIPGAFYLHLERDLSGPKTAAGRPFRGRHPLPDIDEFAATVGHCGIVPSSRVVIVDRQGGMMAARAWWLLRWLGHRDVAVLDGAMAAWRAAGGELESGDQPPHDAAPYPHQGAAMPTIDAAGLLEVLGRRPLVDARAPERFRGEVEPLDARAGHIPGARNRFFKDNLDSDGRFKDAARLRADFEPMLGGRAPAELVHQCGSGVTACHNLLAMEVAGMHGSSLYPGSWSEWSADPTRPVATG